MVRSFAELIILLTVSILAAFILNLVNPEGIPLFGQWDPDKGLVYAGEICIASLNQIDDIDALDLFLQAEAVFVDARALSDYRSGHIPGSYNLPINAVDDAIHDFLDTFPVDTQLIVYCSGPECYDAPDLMTALKEYGYQNVSVYYKGYLGWKNAGRPIEVSEDDADEQR
jgi:rhodanese-related sulfurtransferase